MTPARAASASGERSVLELRRERVHDSSARRTLRSGGSASGAAVDEPGVGHALWTSWLGGAVSRQPSPENGGGSRSPAQHAARDPDTTSVMMRDHDVRAGAGDRTAQGREGRGDRRDRAGAARVHDPGRPRGRRDPRRAAGRAGAGGRRDDAAQPRPPERRAQPQGPAGRGHRARARQEADVVIEGMRPGRDRAARPRPRRLPERQPSDRLRPDDRLGPGRPARAGRRARHELHRHHRRAADDGPGQVAARTSRATWSATSAAARRTSSSASSPPSSRRRSAARAR